MPVSMNALLDAFLFLDAARSSGGGEALVCRQTGKIYLRSDLSDIELDDELPDDIDDREKYASIPGKWDLDLGKPLVVDFAREFLPDDFDEVREIFNRRGAYAKFKALLVRRRALDRWHAFEDEATERALRDWCAVESIEIVD